MSIFWSVVRVVKVSAAVIVLNKAEKNDHKHLKMTNKTEFDRAL